MQDQALHHPRPLVATAGCRAYTNKLRSVAWLGKFKPDLPPRYDGTADPAEFLQLYELGIEAANGDEKVMVEHPRCGYISHVSKHDLEA